MGSPARMLAALDEVEATWRREAGIASVSEHTPEDWKSRCDEALAGLAVTGDDFTSDEVHALVGEPPNHVNALGARFSAAVTAGLITQVGTRRSTRPESHGRHVRIWRGTR